MNLGLTSRVALGAIALGITGVAMAADFGATIDNLLARRSRVEFGFGKPTTAADVGDNGIDRENETARQRQDLARGLTARYVARNVAQLADMISFWPDDIHYTHLIVCIEQGRSGTTPGGNSGLNAAVQRVDVTTGAVATILHGMERCDGIRTTQWGTGKKRMTAGCTRSLTR
jgi:hypothetical protein